MENDKGWFKPSDHGYTTKWYNSKDEVIYMNDKNYELCRKVHDVDIMDEEEGLFTYRVNNELAEIQDITK